MINLVPSSGNFYEIEDGKLVIPEAYEDGNGRLHDIVVGVEGYDLTGASFSQDTIENIKNLWIMNFHTIRQIPQMRVQTLESVSVQYQPPAQMDAVTLSHRDAGQTLFKVGSQQYTPTRQQVPLRIPPNSLTSATIHAFVGPTALALDNRIYLQDGMRWLFREICFSRNARASVVTMVKPSAHAKAGHKNAGSGSGSTGTNGANNSSSSNTKPGSNSGDGKNAANKNSTGMPLGVVADDLAYLADDMGDADSMANPFGYAGHQFT